MSVSGVTGGGSAYLAAMAVRATGGAEGNAGGAGSVDGDATAASTDLLALEAQVAVLKKANDIQKLILDLYA